MKVEDQQRFEVQAWGDRDGGHIEFRCTRCGHDAWIDEPQSLAELNQRADEHAEVCP